MLPSPSQRPLVIIKRIGFCMRFVVSPDRQASGLVGVGMNGRTHMNPNKTTIVRKPTVQVS